MASGSSSTHAHPPKTTFIDAVDVVFDATIPYDLRYFQSLSRFVQSEPWLTRDKAMIDQLKSIGIEKGKPFKPDAKTQDILNAAAQEARAWLDIGYEATYLPPFYEGSHWALPVLPEVVKGQSTSYAKPDIYPVDGRGVTYSMGFIGIKHLGAGQYYLMTSRTRMARDSTAMVSTVSPYPQTRRSNSTGRRRPMTERLTR
jgi:hypothetical protein